jgi:CIC family chloride channel protein
VVLSTYLNRESIYSLKLAREGIHLRRGVEVNVMNSIPVGSVMRPPRPVIFEDMRFNDLLRFIEDHEDTSFPVVDRGNRLFGVIAYRDLRSALRRERSPEMDRLVMAGDLAVTEPETVTPDQNLNHAMQLFGMRDLSVLPVVAADDDRRLVGKLYRSDVLSAYRRALLRNA